MKRLPITKEQRAEIRGAKRVIGALVKKYGPFEVTVDELASVDADPGSLTIDSTANGFTYRYEAAQAPELEQPKGDEMITDDSPETRARSERFRSYTTGWKHGASAKTRATRFVDHPTRPDLSREYELGYVDGRDTAFLAAARCAERIGYDPRMSILRADPESGQSESKADE